MLLYSRLCIDMIINGDYWTGYLSHSFYSGQGVAVEMLSIGTHSAREWKLLLRLHLVILCLGARKSLCMEDIHVFIGLFIG